MRAACTRLTPLDLLPWVLERPADHPRRMAGSGRRLVISRLIASTLCLAYSSLLRRYSPVLRRTSLARASFFSFRSLPLGRRPSRSRRCSSSPSAAGLVFFCSFRFVVARLVRAGALPRLLARALAFFLFFFSCRRRSSRSRRCSSSPSGADLGFLFLVSSRRRSSRSRRCPSSSSGAGLGFVFFSRLVVARLARAGALLRLLARALFFVLFCFFSLRLVGRPLCRWGRLQRSGAGLGSLFFPSRCSPGCFLRR